MSRRTKLITLTVFLVLLAIPVVYLVLSWSPANPLRFRLLSQRESGNDPFKDLATVIEVANTSSTAIHLMEVEFRAPWRPGADDGSHGPAFSHRLILHKQSGATAPTGIIPPKGAVRYNAWIGGYDRQRVELEHAEMTYDFRSETKVRVDELLARICRYIPESITRHLPRPWGDRDTSPLEVPST